ncbi:hypothetical protein DP939_23895 [Spongiactinospora rosea]|uniref:Uncharacterized protein n=1 Tax=Spongiactinospora rosea TaxID=2248750 RepID=A0A366LVP6_9ACTN|nr:hypothetical protein [Spongiactinospora rosea]RBQ17439.1 hypothetical protein DP939_23895 [Spongiactinospora rosea]
MTEFDGFVMGGGHNGSPCAARPAAAGRAPTVERNAVGAGARPTGTSDVGLRSAPRPAPDRGNAG